MKQSARREDLDRAKGLAILLVVFGHIVARDPPTGNQWYVLAKAALYQFHMPFFMYLSGYVTFLSGAARLGPGAWPALVQKRASRLLLPFLIFGLAIIVGKMALGAYVYVDNKPTSFWEAVVGLVWKTDSSAAHSVWYVAVLFLECILTPPLMRLLRGRVYVLVLLAVALYFLPIPHVMYLDEVADFYIFFLLGGLAADFGERWLIWIDGARTSCLLAFGAALIGFVAAVLAGLVRTDVPRLPIPMLVCGMLAMPALHGLVRHRSMAKSAILLFFGYYTFVIYLLNTPWIGVAKALMLKGISWDRLNFLLYVPILMAAGVFGPILTKQILLRRLAFLDRITQ